MPPNTPTNGKADMIQLSAARSPPKLRCSDGRAMVALPTCRAAAMPAKITLATASHRGLAWGADEREWTGYPSLPPGMEWRQARSPDALRGF